MRGSFPATNQFMTIKPAQSFEQPQRRAGRGAAAATPAEPAHRSPRPAHNPSVGRANAPAVALSRTTLATHATEAPRGEAPEWVALLPAGTFAGRDGRGPFRNADPEAVIQATQALKMEAGIPVDYDHATDFAAPQGRPAPAAGWIKQLQVRAGAIWGRVEWTPQGAKALSTKLYRYISPVFQFDKKPGVEGEQGDVVRILRAALTNNPNLYLTAIAASETTLMAEKADAQATQELDLPEVLKSLKKVFPDASNATLLELVNTYEEAEHGAEPEAEPEAAAESEPEPDDGGDDGEFGMLAGDEGGDHDDDDGDDADEVAAQESKRKAYDDEARAGRRANRELDRERKRGAHSADAQIAALVTTVNAMRAERARERAQRAVDEAVRQGRLSPAQREWAISYCARDAGGFAEFIARQPRLDLSAEALSRQVSGDGQHGAGLSAVELAVCRELGVSPQAYQKAREAGPARMSFINK